MSMRTALVATLFGVGLSRTRSLSTRGGSSAERPARVAGIAIPDHALYPVRGSIVPEGRER
jgi:hypothetical protein